MNDCDCKYKIVCNIENPSNCNLEKEYKDSTLIFGMEFIEIKEKQQKDKPNG